MHTLQVCKILFHKIVSKHLSISFAMQKANSFCGIKNEN